MFALGWLSPNWAGAEERPFEGLRALVVEPENFWGWDAAIFGALHERHFDVTYAPPEALEDLDSLSSYDLVASNIRRGFTPAQVANLKEYVSQGGALYGSWGGPMGASDLLREVCHVAATQSVRITGMTLLESPLAQGLAERDLPFPAVIGHAARGRWEIVAVTPLAGGLPVAQDAAGHVLGVLGQYGQGRTAILGFGPENDKYFARRESGPVMMDNLLAWLLEERLKRGPRRWPGVVEVSLPARAEVRAVFLNGQRLDPLQVKAFGSLQKIQVDVKGVREGQEATIRVTYPPLTGARNVETFLHLPWASFPRGGPPRKLAEWLESVHATVCQPLLREGNGHAYYRGMPEDTPDPVSVTGYPGNFLAEFIEECHQRGIKVLGGLYLESPTTLKRHPEAVVVQKDGQKVAQQACFNNPEGQEYNLATIRHLLDHYHLDGVILDDNYELPGYDCYCAFCQEGFRQYCARQGVASQDPTQISEGPLARHWREYKLEATRNLAARVSEIAHEHHLPAGGWVGAGWGSVHLGPVFDFLGGMVYTEPPRAARLMLAALGKCQFITLLWAPSERPERMEQEVREAVQAGSAVVGFWVYPPGHEGSGAFRMLEGSTEAIARAFARVEEEWFHFYRDQILTGDARFVILDGQVSRQEMTLRVKNLGRKAGSRIQGPLDLEALLPVTTSLSFQGPSGLKETTEFVAVGQPFHLTVAIQNLRRRAFPKVPVRLELPEDVELLQGTAEDTVDLAAHSVQEIPWVLRMKREGRRTLRCSVSADPEKPDTRELTLVGKPERALRLQTEKIDCGVLDPGARGSLPLTLENLGLTPAQNLTATITGQVHPWLRVEGLPQGLKAPDWRAGIPSSASFRLAYDLPAEAAAGPYAAELVIRAEGFEPQRAPVTWEVVALQGLVIGVVRSDNRDWPEATNEEIYSLLQGWAGEEGFTLIGFKRDDPRLLDPTYLRRIHLLYFGSIRSVPQDVNTLAQSLQGYVEGGGWLVGDGYGFAWDLIDIRPELRDWVGLKWAHPNSNDGFSDAHALRVTARHPLSEGLELNREIPLGYADYGGSIYRLTPVRNDLTIPIVLCDSEEKYPYVAIRDLGRGRCIMFSPLMGTFTERYKTSPAQTILRNLLRWRKAEWEQSQ